MSELKLPIKMSWPAMADLAIEPVVYCSKCKHLDRNRGDYAPTLGIFNVVCTRLGFQFPAAKINESYCSWGELKKKDEQQ